MRRGTWLSHRKLECPTSFYQSNLHYFSSFCQYFIGNVVFRPAWGRRHRFMQRRSTFFFSVSQTNFLYHLALLLENNPSLLQIFSNFIFPMTFSLIIFFICFLFFNNIGIQGSISGTLETLPSAFLILLISFNKRGISHLSCVPLWLFLLSPSVAEGVHALQAVKHKEM